VKTQITEAAVKRLAEGLLQIAGQAMPDSYFRNDSRCRFARKILKQIKELRNKNQ
jgi:hypothetical protein